MKKLLFLTNYASPYRVQFFDELGKFMDVTVLFSDRTEVQSHRSTEWFVQSKGHFRLVQLKRAGAIQGRDFCPDVRKWLTRDYDAIIVCGYSSPTVMYAMAWLRLKKIPFYMEVDGGLIREDSWIKYQFKKILVSAATFWIGSGREAARYLVHYGAKEERVFSYPFTSLWEKDILMQAPSAEEKQLLRQKLGMTEEKILLYVGRYDPKKGMDELLHILPQLDKNVGVYFVGGEPKEEHLRFCREAGVGNAHFVGFQVKEELARYYQAADVFVLPTWSDVWGLVINEAMAFGLPVITTDKCVAGMELVENGVNGYIVPVKNQEALTAACSRILAEDYRKMGENALEAIRPYTVENMVKAHVEIFA